MLERLPDPNALWDTPRICFRNSGRDGIGKVMKTLSVFLASMFVLALHGRGVASAADAARDSGDKIRVLVVTGGHDFEKDAFSP